MIVERFLFNSNLLDEIPVPVDSDGIFCPLDSLLASERYQTSLEYPGRGGSRPCSASFLSFQCPDDSHRLFCPLKHLVLIHSSLALFSNIYP